MFKFFVYIDPMRIFISLISRHTNNLKEHPNVIFVELRGLTQFSISRVIE